MATDSAALDESAATDAEAGDSDTPSVSADDLGGLADADTEEAAAIAVAIAAHLRDRQAAAAAAAAATEDDDGESRRSWAFAGRLEAIGEPAGRPPNNSPKDGWTAADRADRF
jgi:hypothetical protein